MEEIQTEKWPEKKNQNWKIKTAGDKKKPPRFWLPWPPRVFIWTSMWTIRLYKALNPIPRSKFLRKLTKMSKWSKNVEIAKKCQILAKMAEFDIETDFKRFKTRLLTSLYYIKLLSDHFRACHIWPFWGWKGGFDPNFELARFCHFNSKWAIIR